MVHGSEVVNKPTYSLNAGDENIDSRSMAADSNCNPKAIRQYFWDLPMNIRNFKSGAVFRSSAKSYIDPD